MGNAIFGNAIFDIKIIKMTMQYLPTNKLNQYSILNKQVAALMKQGSSPETKSITIYKEESIT